jgi:DNA-binding protein HU-beta
LLVFGPFCIGIGTKTLKYRKKPVETEVFRLTSSRVGLMLISARFLRTRMNTGDFNAKWKVREMGERPMLTSNSIRKEYTHMAKGMTKTQLIRAMAEKMEVTSKQASSFFTLLADTAVKETKKNGEFTIPGIGKLVKAERKARVGRNPQTGEAIKIKAKTVVKFRVAKVAKDTIAPPKK